MEINMIPLEARCKSFLKYNDARFRTPLPQIDSECLVPVYMEKGDGTTWTMQCAITKKIVPEGVRIHTTKEKTNFINEYCFTYAYYVIYIEDYGIFNEPE